MKFRFLLLLTFLLATSSHAAESLLWQIGRFDGSYSDLAIPGSYQAYRARFPRDVSFTVGKDDPARAWPFIHPGPDDAWARSRVHPFAIQFDLADPPKGVYTLTIALVDTHGDGPPTYSVSLNGTESRLPLPRGHGDGSLTDPALGQPYTLSFPIPAVLLKPGRNRIVLKSIAGSWLLYDALKMTRDPDAALPPLSVKRISLTPTILLVRSGKQLRQIVRLSAELSRPGASVNVAVYAGAFRQQLPLRANLLGIASAELQLPEVSKPTPLEVSLEGSKATVSCQLAPIRHWKLYVQASTHVDVGYTDFQERVIQRHNMNMSLALDLCARYPDFRWNTEAAWVEDNYLSGMPPARKREFLQRTREGRIGCQAVYGNMLTGICSHEELIRCLYYAHETATRNGIPFDVAMSSDVPTQVWSLPTVLAGAGIRYFSAGLNLARADSFSRLFSKSPFYWQGPDGSRVLTWLAPGYGYASRLELPQGVSRAEPNVVSFLSGFERAGYPYDAVLAFGGFGDNQPLSPGLAATVHEWNQRYAYPQIILCRGPEFFREIESRFRDRIPTISGDGGVYWEDGAGSSALETAMVRRAKEILSTAEKLHSLSATLGRARYPADAFQSAWKSAILYDEHTWGAHCSISAPEDQQTTHQWEYKADFARKAERTADDLLRRGLDSLAGLVRPREPSAVVFNPLSWPAGGWVETTGPDGRRYELEARDIPPLGYKVIPLGAPAQVPGVARNESLDAPLKVSGRFYDLVIDPRTGAVTRLFDRELKRELADPSAPYGINQYLYVTGQGSSIKEATGLSVSSITTRRLPRGLEITITGSAANTPRWVGRIVLNDDTKRIDFLNTLIKTPTLRKEAGYFAFPFALPEPQFRIELPDGILDPARNALEGACMQWYCAQDMVAIASRDCAVVWTALDSPLITLSDINRESFRSPLPLDKSSIYAYVFNNYWFTNYKASQGGELKFRFALTSMPAYDPVAAVRFGQSVRNPLLVRACTPGTGRAPETASLCRVSPASVVIQAAKRAESGRGLILRLREISGKPTAAIVTLPTGIGEAHACNLVEDPQSPLAIAHGQLTLHLQPNALATILLE